MALATAVVVGLSLVSSLRFVDHWRGSTESRDYFANAARTLGTPDDPTPLVNVSVPQYLMWGFDYPLTPTCTCSPRTATGSPSRGSRTSSSSTTTGSSGPCSVAPVVTTDGPEEGCVDRLTARHPVTLQLTDTVDGTDWWARLPYATQQPTGVRIEAGDTTHEVTLDPGLRNLYFSADGHFDEVTLTLTGPGRWVCVGNLSLGFPQALESDGNDESGSAAP